MTAAIVLAGGRSSRLGTAKEDVLVGNQSLLTRTLAACGECEPVVVVGPYRTELESLGVTQVQESPPFGGPVAGIAAALEQVGHDVSEAVVLACDMPRVAEAIRLLGSVPTGVDALLVADAGRLQPLAGRYRVGPLREALASEPAAGRSMRSVVEQLHVVTVEAPPGTTADIDTPGDLVAIESHVTVSDVMITAPKVLDADASVRQVREHLESQHVHVALLVDGQRLVAAVDRDDLPGEQFDQTAAAPFGSLADRVVSPEALVAPVATQLRATGRRRLAVVDSQGTLCGLLCLKKSRNGFCSDHDVRSRAGD